MVVLPRLTKFSRAGLPVRSGGDELRTKYLVMVSPSNHDCGTTNIYLFLLGQTGVSSL